MAMMKYIVCVAILAASLKDVRAISEEEKAAIFEDILPHIKVCQKELGIDEDALKEAKEKKSIDGIDECFFACVFKRAEVMDDKGMFIPEKALEQTKKHLSDEEDIKTATEVINECAEVNTADVNDGESGCDRGKLLMGCLIKNKQKLIFLLNIPNRPSENVKIRVDADVL